MSGKTHLVIPDTQAKPGVPTDHLEWIGKYILERRPDVVIHLGDHADMPSLSSYDKGTAKAELRRYQEDIDAANEAFDILNKPINDFNRRMRAQKMKQWDPRKVILLGNHEERIDRYENANAELTGAIGTHQLNYRDHGWEVYPFKEVVWIDGIAYSHYFYNPLSGRPWGGMIQTRLKNIGHSFTQGHTQTLDTGIRYVQGANGPVAHRGLICGACYLHDEDYKGPQGNAHWRGIIVKHEVRDGDYDIMEVSLDYLCRKYEGKPLAEFKKEIF